MIEFIIKTGESTFGDVKINQLFIWDGRLSIKFNNSSAIQITNNEKLSADIYNLNQTTSVDRILDEVTGIKVS